MLMKITRSLLSHLKELFWLRYGLLKESTTYENVPVMVQKDMTIYRTGDEKTFF